MSAKVSGATDVEKGKGGDEQPTAVGKAVEGVSAANEMAGEVEAVKSDMPALDDIKGFFFSVRDLFMAPVAGGKIWRGIYLVLALFAFAFFLYTFADNAKTWRQPLSFVEVTFEPKLTYPDIYVCVPASVLADMATNTNPAGTAAAVSIRFDGWQMQSTGSAACNPNGLVQKQSADGYFPAVSPFTRCPTKTYVSNTARENFEVNARATALANKLPTAQKNNVEYKALCYYFEIQKEADGEYTQADFNSNSFIGGQWTFTPPAQDSTYFEMYITKPGDDPIDTRDGKKFVNASQSLAGAQGMNTLAEIIMDEIKDETAGDTDFFKTYRLSSATALREATLVDSIANNKPVMESESASILMWRFGTHVIRKITVRRKTVGEIWAEIGGLWAGALAITSLFFSLSGHMNDDDQEVFIFRYLPGRFKNKFLEGYKPKDDETPATTARVDALEKMIEELKAKST